MSADLSQSAPDSSATEDFLADAHSLFDAVVNRKEISNADRYSIQYRFQSLLDEYLQRCPSAIGKLWISTDQRKFFYCNPYIKISKVLTIVFHGYETKAIE